MMSCAPRPRGIGSVEVVDRLSKALQGRYAIMREIGAGGMSAPLRAYPGVLLGSADPLQPCLP